MGQITVKTISEYFSLIMFMNQRNKFKYTRLHVEDIFNSVSQSVKISGCCTRRIIYNVKSDFVILMKLKSPRIYGIYEEIDLRFVVLTPCKSHFIVVRARAFGARA